MVSFGTTVASLSIGATYLCASSFARSWSQWWYPVCPLCQELTDHPAYRLLEAQLDRCGPEALNARPCPKVDHTLTFSFLALACLVVGAVLGSVATAGLFYRFGRYSSLAQASPGREQEYVATAPPLSLRDVPRFTPPQGSSSRRLHRRRMESPASTP